MTCFRKQPDSLQIPKASSVSADNARPEVSHAKQRITNSAAILTDPYPLTETADAFQARYSAYIGYTIEAGQLELSRLGMNAKDVKKSIECLGFKKLDEDMAECLVADGEKLSLTILTSREDYPAISGPSYLTAKLSADPLHETLASDWRLNQYLHQIEEKMTQANTRFLTGSGTVFSVEYFLPLAMSMTDSSRLEETVASRPGTYLIKSVRGSTPRFRQLHCIHSDSKANALFDDSLLSNASSQTASIQAYIERPLLVDKRKFDIRTFLLLVCPKRGGASGRPHESGFFAFLHPGFAHLRLDPFDPQDPEPDNNKYPTSQELIEASTWYPDELNAYLNRKRGSRLSQDWAKAVLYPQAGAILGYLAALLRPNLHDRDSATSSFRMLGVRMLLDDSLRLHLLTVDDNAMRWNRQNSVIESVLSSLWCEAVCLACEIAVRFRSSRTVCDERLMTRRNFRMIYSSEDLSLARQSVTLMYD